MSKIIITADGVDDGMALTYVLKVINQGKISDGGNKYCYITTFESGHVVYAEKTKAKSYTFRVWIKK